MWLMATTRDYPGRCKIAFRLTPDEDGYPPADWESLWAITRSDGCYEIDNIPFFARGVASGDLVSAHESLGQLVFEQVLQSGGHSTLRVIMTDLARKDEIRSRLLILGCESEGSHLPSLFSVDVPPDADYAAVSSLLAQEEDQGVLEYEEAALRHG